MTKFCIKIYRFFNTHRIYLWLSMATLFIFCGYFASQIHLEEDLSKLMPSSQNEDGSTKLAFANLRIKDKTFLLFEGKEGMPTERIIEVCDTFINSLKIKNATLPTDQQPIGDIFYDLPEELLPNAIEYLSAHFPAYIDTNIYNAIDTLLTYKAMSRQMQQNRTDLSSTVGAIYPELIQIDPIGLRNILKEQLSSLSNSTSRSYKIIDRHFFVPDSTVCIAFLTPTYSATNTGQGSMLFEMLNKQIEHFTQNYPDIKISYHGTPASGFYNSLQIKSDLSKTITISMVIVLLFILACFRRYSTIPLLLLPVAFGTLFGLAVMYFLKGKFSLLALGIGAIILGVALSYVLHIITHYFYTGNPEQVLREEVKPVCLGCLTTIGSFMGLIFIRTELLQDFGVFATLAILGTTMFSLLFLPSLLYQQKNKTKSRAFELIDKINAFPIHRNKSLIIILSVITLLCVSFYFIKGTTFDANMHSLGYKAKITSYSEELLRTKTYTGDKQKYFATIGHSMEEALERFTSMTTQLDSLQQVGLIKDYTHTNKLLVPLRIQQERINAWKNYWSEEKLNKVRTLIAQTAPQAGIKPEVFDLFFKLATTDYQTDAIYQVGIIPKGYLSTLMEKSYDGSYLCFTSVRCANDTSNNRQSDYNRICDVIASSPNQLVLDTYYYTIDTLTQLNEDFNILQWISMLFVLVVLLVSFRFNIKYTLLGIMPILLSWLIVLGIMAAFDMQFNLINIIISTFIFGIGVDYSIFIMNGLIDSKKNTSLLRLHKTAVFLSAVILIITIGAMWFAEHPAIRSVGFSTLIGLVAAVLLSYVIQPAIFKFIEKQ